MNQHYASATGKKWLRMLLFCLCAWPAALMAQQPCDNDIQLPVCIAPPSVTVNTCFPNNFTAAAMQALFGVATATDNCSASITNESVILNGLGVVYDTTCHKGVLSRRFTASDTSGNTSTCFQNITVNQQPINFDVSLPGHATGDVCGAPSVFGTPVVTNASCGELTASAYTDQVFIIGNTTKIERTWSMINWCTFDPNFGDVTLPPQDINGDGITGDAFTFTYNGTNIIVNGVPILAATPEQLIKYTQVIFCNSVTIQGIVFADGNNDCSFNGADNKLTGWKVRAESMPSGLAVTVNTSNNGSVYNYSIVPNVAIGDTAVQVYVLSPLNTNGTCTTVYTYPVSNITSNTVYTNNYAILLDAPCPVMTVDLSTPFLRRCVGESTYWLHYANYGGVTAAGSYIDISLDPFISFVSSATPSTNLGNNNYRFNVGNVASGGSGTITLNVLVSCSALPGQQHCSEAHIYPDSLCGDQMPWNGPAILASAVCDGDSVRLELKNIGNENMTQASEFLIVEDVIMYRSGSIQLQPNEKKDFVMPANGATWHINAEQVPNAPYGAYTFATVEGCGTNTQGGFTTGVANQFALPPSPNAVDLDCRPNIGSFDPNDKQAVPVGYGPEHFINPNTDIEYMIRFQNTGTDTAFLVVVEDQLSAFMEPASVRPGASSHPYWFTIDDTGKMRFIFDQIKLPDSTTNLAKSNGFVQFSVAQKADLADNTLIENTANIFFDSNAPVQTNTVYHNIGREYVEMSGTTTIWEGAEVLTYPNPARQTVYFEVNGIDQNNWTLEIYDLDGKSVLQVAGKSNEPLPVNVSVGSGMYPWKIHSNGRLVATGTMVKF